MKKLQFLSAGLTALAALGIAANALAKDDNEKGQLFTVPFVLSAQSSANTPVAEFTLKNPAILEFIYVVCQGPGNIGYVKTDGGPLGVNGTTGTLSTSGVLALGEIGPNQVDISTRIFLEFVPGSNVFDSSIYKSQTRLSIPVKAKVSLTVEHDGDAESNTILCNGTFVFRSS